MSGIDAMLAAGRIEELISSSPSAASWWRRIEEDLRRIEKDLRRIGVELRSMEAAIDAVESSGMDAAIDAVESSGKTKESDHKPKKDVIYILEDAIDDIEKLIIEQKRLHYSSSSSKLPRLLAVLAKYAPFHLLRARHKIVYQIQGIRDRLHDWEVKRPAELEIVARHRTPAAVSLPTMESIFVGRERDRSYLIDRLLDGGEEGDRKTITVEGMGGIGKTTLVRTVFNDVRIRAHFHPRIWASVSDQFEDDDIYRSMLKQLGDDDDDAAHSDGDQKSQDQLARMLHGKLQGKTYLVVLDDVWSTDALERLVSSLPLPGQGAVMGRGSRVVVTSRNIDVAEAVGSHFILRLDPLSIDESWTLFCESAFSYMMQKCPSELEGMAKSLVEHCGGLPAAIKLYGNFLRGKDISAWARIYFTAKSKDANADACDRLMNVLLHRFYELQPLVKPCLLYLGLFPKGCSMKCAKISRLWLAEGFITKSADGKDPDEIANDYLLQLAQRSLIQGYKFDSSGRMLRFRVHDLMHDAIASIGMELNFISISDRGDDLRLQSRPRRLAANGLGGLEIIPRCGFCYDHLRSLILSADPTDVPLLSSFARLKVLHLKGMQLASFPPDILKLFHLKYLHLRRTNIRELPEDIWKLQNLQTLDLKRSPITELPKGIVKLRHLRHLLVYEQVYLGVFFPKGMDTLTSLEKLSNLNITSVDEQLEELRRMTKLKRLGITSVSPENGAALCKSISRLSYLKSLYIYSGDDHMSLNVETLLSTASTSLRSINLRGRLISFPKLDSPALASSLKKVRLNFSKLNTDPFTSLQHDLYNLVELYLHNDAYRGEELHARGGGFGKLRKLYVQNLSILRRVVIDGGAMANLEYLELIECKKLERVPTGIEHLTHIKEFYVGMVPDSCIESIRTAVDSNKLKKGTKVQEIFRAEERLYRRPL